MTDQTTQDYLKHAAGEAERPLTAAMRHRKPNYEHVAAKDPAFRVHVPIDYHPDALGDDNGTIAQAKGRRALDALWQVHTKLNETAVMVHDRAKLASQVEPIALRAMKSMKEEIAGLDRQHNHATNEIKAALGSGVGTLQAEIRAVVRAMPEGERLGFCRALLANGAVDELKAIVAVPAMLSGLRDDDFAWVRGEAEKLVAPKHVAERDNALAARDRCQRALDDFDMNMSSNIRRWRSSDDQKIANLVSSLTPKKDAD